MLIFRAFIDAILSDGRCLDYEVQYFWVNSVHFIGRQKKQLSGISVLGASRRGI